MQGPSDPNQNSGKDQKIKVNKTKPIQKQLRSRKKTNKNSQGIFRDEASNYIMQQEEDRQKQRRSSGAAKGRPKQRNQDMIKVAEDPTLPIQQCFMEYLDAIGLKHGLVFREKERQKFMKENLGITWNSSHQWEYQKEYKKIQDNKKVISAIKRYVGEEKEDFKDLIIKAFINICEISAEECTEQMYEILAEAIQSKINNQDEDKKQARAKKYLEKSKFLSGKFTKEHVKYWVEVIGKVTEIEQHFIRFFSNVCRELSALLEKPQKIKEYLVEQELMKQALEKIRTKNS